MSNRASFKIFCFGKYQKEVNIEYFFGIVNIRVFFIIKNSVDLCIVEENYQNSGFDNVHEGISVVPFSKNVYECKKKKKLNVNINAEYCNVCYGSRYLVWSIWTFFSVENIGVVLFLFPHSLFMSIGNNNI